MKMRCSGKIPRFYLKAHQLREEELHIGHTFWVYNYVVKKVGNAHLWVYLEFCRIFSLYRRVPRIRNKLSLMDKCSEHDNNQLGMAFPPFFSLYFSVKRNSIEGC